MDKLLYRVTFELSFENSRCFFEHEIEIDSVKFYSREIENSKRSFCEIDLKYSEIFWQNEVFIDFNASFLEALDKLAKIEKLNSLVAEIDDDMTEDKYTELLLLVDSLKFGRLKKQKHRYDNLSKLRNQCYEIMQKHEEYYTNHIMDHFTFKNCLNGNIRYMFALEDALTKIENSVIAVGSAFNTYIGITFVQFRVIIGTSSETIYANYSEVNVVRPITSNEVGMIGDKLNMIKRDDNLKRLNILLMNQKWFSYINAYKIYDLIDNDCKKIIEKHKHNFKLFTNTANNVSFSSILKCRHGKDSPNIEKNENEVFSENQVNMLFAKAISEYIDEKLKL